VDRFSTLSPILSRRRERGIIFLRNHLKLLDAVMIHDGSVGVDEFMNRHGSS
jgi:hypothetical protein